LQTPKLIPIIPYMTFPMDYWYAILQTKAVKKKPLRVKRFNEDLVLWRDDKGKVSCLRDRCSHRNTALSLGKTNGDCIECPFHGLRFNGRGECILIPSNGASAKISKNLKVTSYEIREAHGFVWIWWGRPRAELPEIPWFRELEQAKLIHTEASRISPVGFCRMMEANLDFGHFYFVHKFLRMPTMGPLADPFNVKVTGNRIDVTGNLRADDKRTVAENPGISVKGSAIFPGCAMYDAPGKKDQWNPSIAVVAPVDEFQSWFAFRVYIKDGRFRFLRYLYWNLIFIKILFRIIHKQDLRIMTQQRVSTPECSDNLVCSADKGIIQYLKFWQNSQEKMTHQIRGPFADTGENIINL